MNNLGSKFIHRYNYYAFILFLFLSFSFSIGVVNSLSTPQPYIIVDYYHTPSIQPYLEEYFNDASNLNIYRYVKKSQASKLYVWFKYSGDDEDGTLEPIDMVLDGKSEVIQGIVQSRKINDPEQTYKYILVKIYLTSNDSLAEDGVINLSIVGGDRRIVLDYMDASIGEERINLFIINNSLFVNPNPANMSAIKSNREYSINLSYFLPSSLSDYVNYLAIELPYYVVEGERTTNVIELCSDNSDTLPTCQKGENYSFNLNTSKIDTSDSFFDIDIIFKGDMVGGEERHTLYYYLDKNKPTAQLTYSNLNNGSVYYSFDYLNLSFLLNDVYSCNAYLDGKLKVVSNESECHHIYLEHLNQTNHTLKYVVYDYANNSNKYIFNYYFNSSIAYITKEGKIYQGSKEIGEVKKEMENNTGFLIPKYVKRRIIRKIHLWKRGIYGAYIEGNEALNSLNISGCDGFSKVNNNTFVCSQDINNTYIINQSTDTDDLVDIIHYSFLPAHQDDTEISSLNGFDYIVLPINITNVDYAYSITHTPLYNITYNFEGTLPSPWSAFTCQNCEGKIDMLDHYEAITLKLMKKSIYALPLYSFYIPTSTITINHESSDVVVTHKFEVHNTIGINFTNVLVNLSPPYYSSYYFINSSSCTLASPQYIDIGSNENKEIEVNYKCKDIISTKFSYDILTQKGNDTHKYLSAQIELNIPNSPLFNDKRYTYLINQDKLKGFDTRSDVRVFVDDLSTPAILTEEGDIVNITTPKLTATTHTIYLKYWYESTSQQNTASYEDDEKKSNEKNETRKENTLDKNSQNKRVGNNNNKDTEGVSSESKKGKKKEGEENKEETNSEKKEEVRGSMNSTEISNNKKNQSSGLLGITAKVVGDAVKSTLTSIYFYVILVVVIAFYFVFNGNYAFPILKKYSGVIKIDYDKGRESKSIRMEELKKIKNNL